MMGRALKWGGAVAAALAFAGLGAYFAVVGLDKANQIGSLIGSFVALAGLGLSAYGIVQQRRTAPTVPAAPIQEAPSLKTQNVVARGNATQYAVMDGNLNVHYDPAPPEATHDEADS
jgi:hypothetical protein